jgi:hypothetical protein
MASNAGPRPPNPNDKILNVWSKPIEQGDTTNHNAQPTLTDAVSSIKADDFKNIAATPCARNAFLTGIASGFGAGGLRFVVRGMSMISPEALNILQRKTDPQCSSFRKPRQSNELGGRLLPVRQRRII